MSCMIRVDPDEMSATASLLRSTANDVTGIGSGVKAHCCSCSLPAEIEAEALVAAAAIESSLFSIATDLVLRATDLSTRGAAAANDSLAIAASAASGPAQDPTFEPSSGGVLSNWLADMDTKNAATGLGSGPVGSVVGIGSAPFAGLPTGGVSGYNVAELATVLPGLDESSSSYLASHPGETYSQYAIEHPEGAKLEQSALGNSSPSAMQAAGRATGDYFLGQILGGYL